MKSAFLILLVAFSALAEDRALELKSGTVLTADGLTVDVEPGSALLDPRTLVATGKRLADCEAARPVLETNEYHGTAAAMFIIGVVLAGVVGYTAGKLVK